MQQRAGSCRLVDKRAAEWDRRAGGRDGSRGAGRRAGVKKALVGLMALGLVLAFSGVSLAADDEPAVQVIKGDAGCFKCCFKVENAECAAAVKVDTNVFLLTASDKASDATKELIASFKGAAKCTPVVIKGVKKDKSIIADEVTKVEVKKEE